MKIDKGQNRGKIDKIDEESEDDGTYNTKGSQSEVASILQSRVHAHQNQVGFLDHVQAP